jgi:hypothetical protein
LYYKGVQNDDGDWFPNLTEPGAKVIPQEGRNEEDLYSDEIDLQDKMFTFQYVSGGDADLERFRQQVSQSMDSIPVGEGVAGTPVRDL